MNVYDFDRTIYDGDSSVDFYFYCLRSDLRLIRYLPRQAFGFLLFSLRKIDKTTLKEHFFCFLKGISHAEQKAEQFWKVNDRKIYTWYPDQAQTTDVVVSASPYFLLKPICDRLKISELIASDVDPRNGLFRSTNCHDTEKVARFSEMYPEEKIDDFYSDSLSDQPMADMAHRAFYVKKGKIHPWFE